MRPRPSAARDRKRHVVSVPTPDVSRRTFGVTALGMLAAAAVPVLRSRQADGAPTSDTTRGATSPGTGARPAAASAAAAPPVPEVVPRTDWDDGACTIDPGRRSRPERVHLHHTHLPTVAHPREVPEALRSICASHRDRGFGGIGYHYAVDPFGRIWQGRAQLPGRLPERVLHGAHAQGFNHRSLGVVLIGDHDVAPPSTEATIALESLLAFLAWRYDMHPDDTVRVRSTGGGATRFEEGEAVHLPVLCGHRDTGTNTACPGEHLYARLPQLRVGVIRRLELAAA